MSVKQLFEAKAIVHDYNIKVEGMEDRINERLNEIRPKPPKSFFLHALNRAGVRGTKSHSLGQNGAGNGVN